MFTRTLRVATRSSPLAIRQAHEAFEILRKFYPALKFKIVTVETYGDKDKITPLSEVEGSDFFTREIELALLEGRVDFAVHSAKDLPEKLPAGLIVAAITKAKDAQDALVSKGNLRLGELKSGAKIGASSLRRKRQLKRYKADFQVVDIRGNIQERLEKLDRNGLDAIVVAACALARLGLEKRIAERIPQHIFPPHPLQGALAVEVRKDQKELIKLLKVLNER